jgi:hypothetical protein
MATSQRRHFLQVANNSVCFPLSQLEMVGSIMNSGLSPLVNCSTHDQKEVKRSRLLWSDSNLWSECISRITWSITRYLPTITLATPKFVNIFFSLSFNHIATLDSHIGSGFNCLLWRLELPIAAHRSKASLHVERVDVSRHGQSNFLPHDVPAYLGAYDSLAYP